MRHDVTNEDREGYVFRAILHHTSYSWNVDAERPDLKGSAVIIVGCCGTVVAQRRRAGDNGS
jgi:hypothetical protein